MSACSLELSTLSAMENIEANQWDALVGHDQPFLRDAFLHALEASGWCSREKQDGSPAMPVFGEQAN